MGNNFELEYTSKLQQIVSSEKSPDFNIRNEVELTYIINELWSVFIFTENYQRINKGFNFDTQKSGFGTEYKINPTKELEFKWDVKNKSSHKDIARLTIGYTYTIE